MKLNQLKLNETNARRISDEHFEMLKRSVAKRPWMFEARQIVVRRCDNVVLGGNMRVRALLANGTTEIPDAWVRWVDWTPQQCEDFHVVDNENYGEWIADELLNIYGRDRLAEMDVDVGSLLDGLTEPEPPPSDGKTDADEVPAVAEAPRSVRGQIYACGDHRLMCGDATSRDDFARLMAGDLADLVVTDPPYNVAIGKRNRAVTEAGKNNGQKNLGGHIQTDILGDVGISDEECGKTLWLPAFRNLAEFAQDFAAIYVTMPQGVTHVMMMMMMRRSSWQVKHELIWVKNRPTFSMGRLDYDYQHEPICYGWKKSHRFFGGGSQCKSIWRYDKPQRSKLHPTMKPVALIENMLLNSSQRGEIVVDAFGGSGTTAIAAARTGRRARIMELDPHYCDVIRRRWAEFRHGEGCDWEALTPTA